MSRFVLLKKTVLPSSEDHFDSLALIDADMKERSSGSRNRFLTPTAARKLLNLWSEVVQEAPSLAARMSIEIVAIQRILSGVRDGMEPRVLETFATVYDREAIKVTSAYRGQIDVVIAAASALPIMNDNRQDIHKALDQVELGIRLFNSALDRLEVSHKAPFLQALFDHLPASSESNLAVRLRRLTLKELRSIDFHENYVGMWDYFSGIDYVLFKRTLTEALGVILTAKIQLKTLGHPGRYDS